MITKKQYNNKTAIQEDKDKFRELALNKGFELQDIEDFLIDYYENLKGFDYNLKVLKEIIKKENREYKKFMEKRG